MHLEEVSFLHIFVVFLAYFYLELDLQSQKS